MQKVIAQILNYELTAFLPWPVESLNPFFKKQLDIMM